MKNTFQIGREAIGESFIGRKDVLNDLFMRFNLDSTNRSLSIVGLTRVGKSSIIANAFSEEDLNLSGVIYVHIVLSEQQNSIAFWKSITEEIYDQLYSIFHVDNIVIKGLCEEIKKCNISDGNSYLIINPKLKKILKQLNKLKKHTLLVIDEFDSATDLFKGDTKNFEFLRTLSTSAEYDLSTILISRRSLHIIEECSPENSTFHGAFDRITVSGFSDRDMDLYYKKLESCGVILDREERNTLNYYCGRLPYLLSLFGFYLVNSVNQGSQKLVVNVYKENSPQIIRYYKDILNQFYNDKLMDKLLAIVIGPQIYADGHYLELLLSMGLITDTGNRYISVCEHFTDYLQSRKLSFPIWDKIIEAENQMKGIINREMPFITNSTDSSWQETFNNMLIADERLQNKYALYVPTLTRFRASCRRDFNLEVPLIEIMSLKSVTLIIKCNWDGHFKKYFNNEPLGKWQIKLDAIATARNPLAHGHNDYLSDNQKRAVDLYIDEIIESITTML